MRIFMLQRFDLASVSCTRRILSQAEELLRRGHDVLLTDFTHPDRQSEIPALTNLTHLGATIIPLERAVHRFFANMRQLRQIIPAPDIIHLWKSYPDVSIPALYLRRYWNVPLHYDWDDWEPGIAAELTGSPLAGWLTERWERFIPHTCTTMTVASTFLRKIAEREGFPTSRLWDGPVGANVQQFFPREKDDHLLSSLNLHEPLLLYVGQLEVASYAEQAVRVLHNVKKTFPTAQLLIVGGGRKQDVIESYTRQCQLERDVKITGYVPADEIPQYISLADVALAPFEENNVTRAKSPLKIAEYLAMGLPIVASDVGEAKIMASGAGTCVPCGDTEAMAQAVIDILENPDKRKSMRQAGIQAAQTTYNWTSHVDQLEEAYQHALRSLKVQSSVY